jgi:hypothetical protein
MYIGRCPAFSARAGPIGTSDFFLAPASGNCGVFASGERLDRAGRRRATPSIDRDGGRTDRQKPAHTAKRVVKRNVQRRA